MIKAMHFKLQEYVPKHIFDKHGNRAWEFIDSRLIVTNDALREKFGKMIINTWHKQNLIDAYGFRQWSGLRTAEHYRKDTGAPLEDLLEMYRAHDASVSQHKSGRASDSLFMETPVEEVRKYILGHPEEFPFLNALEEGVSWLHGDTRNCVRIKTFKQG